MGRRSSPHNPCRILKTFMRGTTAKRAYLFEKSSFKSACQLGASCKSYFRHVPRFDNLKVFDNLTSMSNNYRLTGEIMIVDDIRKAAINEEIDYLLLKSLLKNYARPRDKITQLLKNKVLIRVKKGLYIFGDKYARKPYTIETLANLIYGPSCISLDYALAFYNMIPERVEVVTSVTNKRDKYFQTPVGIFTYRYLHTQKYPIGITAILIDETHPVLFATPEKALADKIMLGSLGLKLNNEKDIVYYLYEDLRLYPEKIKELDVKKLKKIASIYSNKNVFSLAVFLEKEKPVNEALDFMQKKMLYLF